MTLSEQKKILTEQTELIRKSRIPDVLKNLNMYCKNVQIHKSIVTIIIAVEAQYSRYNIANMMGTEGGRIELDKITVRVIEIIHSLESELEYSTEEKNNLTSFVNEQLTLSISNLQKEYDDCIAKLKTKDMKIEELSTSIETKDKEIVKLNSSVGEKDKEIKKLESLVKSYKNRLKIANIIDNKWFMIFLVVIALGCSYYIGKKSETLGIKIDTSSADRERWKKDSLQLVLKKDSLRRALNNASEEVKKLKGRDEGSRSLSHIPTLRYQTTYKVTEINSDTNDRDVHIDAILNNIHGEKYNFENRNINYSVRIDYYVTARSPSSLSFTFKLKIKDFVSDCNLNIPITADKNYMEKIKTEIENRIKDCLKF